MSRVRRPGLLSLWLVLAALGASAWWWLPQLRQMLDGYLGLDWNERDPRASVAGAAISAISLMVTVLFGVVSAWQNRRSHTDTSTTSVASIPPDPRGLPQMKALAAGQARVHEAIPLPTGRVVSRRRWGAPPRAPDTTLDPDLPLFVKRDLSIEVTEWMRQARTKGGFLLLVGTSSVGKTRLLFDTARQELGEFRVLVPDLGDGGAVNALTGTELPRPVVVWLDELQRFLAGPYFVPDATAGHVPVTAAALRRLLDGDTPVIVLATLWPDYLDQLRATDTDQAGVTRHRHPGAADVLALRPRRLRVDTFTAEEKRRARELGTHDPRLAFAAADDAEFNVTETLAGAPRIMQRYREAPESRQIVVHAAVDARRLGIQGPLTRELLRQAARGYLTGIHPDDTWFDHALDELQRHDRRDDAATAPLLAIPTADHRGILGYTVTDYLLQKLLRERRSALLTDTTWNALIRHTHDSDDRRRLSYKAENRMQYRHAQRLHRTLVDAGDAYAVHRLAELLVKQGKVDEFTALVPRLVDAGDIYAVYRLTELLVEQGKVDEVTALVRSLVDAGDAYAVYRLTELLVEQGKVDEVMTLVPRLVDAGDIYAVYRLTELLIKQGRLDEARALLRTLVNVDGYVNRGLNDLLAKLGWVEELRTRANAGHRHAAGRLVDVLVEQGDVNGAMALLRAHADVDGHYAARRLAGLLIKQRNVDDAMALLRAHADAGDSRSAHQLVDVLVEQGLMGELRTRADAGDGHAARRLAGLLIKQRNVDDAMALLRAHADAGDSRSARRLAGLLIKQRNVDDAMALLRAHADAGDSRSADQLADLLVNWEWVEELRARADAGEGRSARRLAGLLIKQRNVDDAMALLRAHADAGDSRSADQLADLLVNWEWVEELRARADAGDHTAARRLADLLVNWGWVEELRARADAGDRTAASRLVELLAEQGRVEELRTRSDAGDAVAGGRLARLLAGGSEWQMLWKEVHAGTVHAREMLLQRLRDSGRKDEAERLRVWGVTSDGSPADPW
ncbi:SEL1-like repeat protein [Saccharothrix stipae]